jgi:TM2 domain-containing membrane protein YozV
MTDVQPDPVFVPPPPVYVPPPPVFAPPPPVYVPPPKDVGVALILELVPGMFLQTFGIGNLYAGNIGWGLALMAGYWIASAVNVALCFILIGFVTWPLTWCAFAVLACVLAAEKAKSTQAPRRANP